MHRQILKKAIFVAADVIATKTPYLLKQGLRSKPDKYNNLEVRHLQLPVFLEPTLMYMLAHTLILLSRLLSHPGQHSSDFPSWLPTCLLPIGTSLPLILLLILAKFFPLLSASSLLAARASSQQPVTFCSHFICPPPLLTQRTLPCLPALPPPCGVFSPTLSCQMAWSISPAYPLYSAGVLRPRLSWQHDGFTSECPLCESHWVN